MIGWKKKIIQNGNISVSTYIVQYTGNLFSTHYLKYMYFILTSCT